MPTLRVKNTEHLLLFTKKNLTVYLFRSEMARFQFAGLNSIFTAIPFFKVFALFPFSEYDDIWKEFHQHMVTNFFSC